jgi:hypothetical protein
LGAGNAAPPHATTAEQCILVLARGPKLDRDEAQTKANFPILRGLVTTVLAIAGEECPNAPLPHMSQGLQIDGTHGIGFGHNDPSALLDKAR